MKTRHDVEFKVGDTVTFCAYEEDLLGSKRTVRKIQKGSHGDGKYPDGTEDDRLFYNLDGLNITTPNWIVESKYFKL